MNKLKNEKKKKLKFVCFNKIVLYMLKNANKVLLKNKKKLFKYL